MDADLELDALAAPPPLRQRVAAYGIVLSERGLLATQFSDRTAVPGLWGLPAAASIPVRIPARRWFVR